MKTCKQWFETLPETIANEAIKQTSQQQLEQTEPSLQDALFSAFRWKDSAKGIIFWRGVMKKYC